MTETMRDRIRAALPQAAGLLVAAVGAGIVGRPEGWLAVFLPLGPLLVRVFDGLFDGEADRRTWVEPFLFSLVAGAIIAVGWLILWLPQRLGDVAFLFPVGLLFLLLGTLNYVAVSASRTLRAWRGQPLDYPWIPGRLWRVAGLDRSDES